MSEEGLTLAASRWMQEALEAWTRDDQAKVALIAPLAIEFLGKAVLWRTNPVLLVALERDHEASLILLATRPDLSAKGLKTVGLQVLLNRLQNVLPGGLPVPEGRRKRIINVRNGAIHVGSGDESRNVLLDCVTLSRTFLDALGMDHAAFYGAHHNTVGALLDEYKSELARRVAIKLTRARHRLTELEERLGASAYRKATEDLEAQGKSLDPNDFLSDEGEAVDAACCVCQLTGRLFGTVDISPEMDYDVEPMGGGTYAPVPMPYWRITFRPEAYFCTVCRLHLTSPEELAEATLASTPFEVDADDLGADFEVQHYVGYDDY